MIKGDHNNFILHWSLYKTWDNEIIATAETLIRGTDIIWRALISVYSSIWACELYIKSKTVGFCRRCTHNKERRKDEVCHKGLSVTTILQLSEGKQIIHGNSLYIFKKVGYQLQRKKCHDYFDLTQKLFVAIQLISDELLTEKIGLRITWAVLTNV